MTKLLISCFLFLTCDEWEVHTSHEDGLLMLYIEVLINESVDARYQHRIKIHITVKKSWKLCRAQYTFPTEGFLKMKVKDTKRRRPFWRRIHDLGSDDNIITVDWKDREILLFPLIPFNHKPNDSKFRELTSDFISFSKILFEPNFCSVKLKQIFSLEQTLLSVKRNLRSMKQQPSHTSDHVSAC